METNHKEGSKRQVSGLNRFFSYFLLLPIYFYRYFISPMLGPRCRFNPTCSSYAEQAIKRYGIFKGTWLAVCRIAKCHPWHPGGEDPVPPLESDESKSDNHP